MCVCVSEGRGGARAGAGGSREVGLVAARGRRPSAIAKAATGARERGPLAVALVVKSSASANLHL